MSVSAASLARVRLKVIPTVTATKATEGGATGGTDNSTYMTPLRTKQQIDARLADQATAEAGIDNVDLMTPLGTAQAIEAQRPFASQAEAEAGSNNTKTMTPLRSKQSITVNAEVATFTPGGADAVSRTIGTRLNDFASVLDFIPVAVHAGIRARTSTDDLSAYIEKALLACQNVYFPPGRYAYDQVDLQRDGQVMAGAGYGPEGAELYALTATGEHLKIPAGVLGCRVTGFRFSGVTQTSGAFFSFADGYNILDNFFMIGAFQGVVMAASDNKVHTGWFIDTKPSVGKSVSILFGSGLKISNVIMSANLAAQPLAGIFVSKCLDLEIEGCNLYGQGFDLCVEPAGGDGAGAIIATGTYFDTARRGLYIAPSTAGFCTRAQFTGCWFGSHSEQGVAMDASGGGIDDINFTGCRFEDNLGDGIAIAGGVTNVNVSGCAFADNPSGISLSATCQKINVTGSFFGATSQLPGNVYGIYINSGADLYNITGNIFSGNTSGAIAGHSAATTRIVSKNVGVPTQTAGGATLASGTTSVAVNHGLIGTPAKEDILVTPVSDCGSNRFWVSATSSSQFTISTNTAPGGDLFFGWSARLQGG